MKKLKNCLLVILWPWLNGIANPSAIKAITIGDTIPNQLYQLLGSHVNKELQGKAILLDFWEMSCGNCLAALPNLDSMQRQYAGKLAVVTITSKGSYERISALLKKYPRTRHVQLAIITGDSLVRRYFPFELISHLVWIGSDGVVRAITGSSYVTSENIEALVAGKRLNLPVKKDIADFDYEASMLAFAANGVPTPHPLYYSAICGRLNGVDGTSSVVSDSSYGVTRLYFFNMSLLQLCRLALENASAGIEPKQLVLQVADVDRYLNPKNGWLSEWKERNTYCYFLQIPLSHNPALQKQQVRAGLTQQLNSVFGVSMRRESRLLPCLVLKRSPKKNGLLPAPQKGIHYDNLSELIYTLNSNSAFPLAFNETGIHGLVEMPINLPPNAFANQATLNKELAAYGLVLMPEMRLQDRYIVTEETHFSNHLKQPTKLP